MSDKVLIMLKLITGEIVLAEMEEKEEGFLISDPVSVRTTVSPEGEKSISLPFMLGAAQNEFLINPSTVITLAVPDEFFTSFYGSSLFRFFFQSEMRKLSIEGKDSFDNAAINRIQSKKNELTDKYGLVEELMDMPVPNPVEDAPQEESTLIVPNNKVLH